MKKVTFIILGSMGIGLIAAFFFFFMGSAPRQGEMKWGVNFSQKQAESLGIDWKEIYLALLDDLGAERLKIAVAWDVIEPEKNAFQFGDLDWQMQELEKRGKKALLAIGMKTPRWPECHIPSWAKALKKEEQQEHILSEVEMIVSRYRASEALIAWQVENEPFFPFGVCPWTDSEFLAKEIALVKSLDSEHPVVVTDSGEGSLWWKAALKGDIVGTTLYRKVWFHKLSFYFESPLPPVSYQRRAQLVKFLFGKEVIGVELQAEPWTPFTLSEASLDEQEKTMNLARLKDIVEFAKDTGFKEFYFWGGEWWYWMKTKQNNPEIWNEIKQILHPYPD